MALTSNSTGTTCILIYPGTLPLEIAVSDLITGNNSIQIVLVDEQGDSATFSTDFAVDRPTGNRLIE